MKKSNYPFIFLGIGIGIILTSTVYIFDPFIKYKTYTDKQIIEEARKLGMIFVKESIDNEKNVESEEKVKEDNIIKFSIFAGDTLKSISDRLYVYGIIDNEEEFTQFVIDKDMQKNLIPGDYELKSGLSYSSILTILSHN